MHCWWEWKMVQPLWKTVWQILTKLNILLPSNDIISNDWKIYVHKKTCTWMFTAAFFSLLPSLEATKMSFSRWIDKLVHPDNEILSSTKKNWAIKPWRKHKCILLSERSQSEKTICFMIPNIETSGKDKTVWTDQRFPGGLEKEGWIGKAQRIFRAVTFSVWYCSGGDMSLNISQYP